MAEISRQELRQRLAAVVLFSVPDDTPVPKVRELVERMADNTLAVAEELGIKVNVSDDERGRATTCVLHGKPLGPPPAKNCEDCRAAIDETLSRDSVEFMEQVELRYHNDPMLHMRSTRAAALLADDLRRRTGARMGPADFSLARHAAATAITLVETLYGPIQREGA